jgi:hypothetical protein
MIARLFSKKHPTECEELLEQIAQNQPLPTGGLENEAYPMVSAANWLAHRRSALEPRPGFVRASRLRLLARLRARGGKRPWLHRHWGDIAWWQHPLAHLALVVLLVASGFLSASRLTAASRAWLPGDLLYPLKPMAEQAALLASLTKEGDAQLHIQFAHRRLIEAQSLVFENRYEQIPAAVADFDHHVSQAVILVNQMAGVQQDEARSLATELQQALTGQMGMIILLTNLTPDTSQAEFHRLLIISEDGVLGVQNVLPPDGGDAQHQGWKLIPRVSMHELGEG